MGQILSIKKFITAILCCVDDLLQEATQGQPTRAKGFATTLADSAVLTLGAEYQEIGADQAIWKYFRRHWLALFPGIRSVVVRQAANL